MLFHSEMMNGKKGAKLPKSPPAESIPCIIVCALHRITAMSMQWPAARAAPDARRAWRPLSSCHSDAESLGEVPQTQQLAFRINMRQLQHMVQACSSHWQQTQAQYQMQAWW